MMRPRTNKPARRPRSDERRARGRARSDETPVRRIGSESSATRAVLLDVTERLMVEEGYAAVSSRRVAAAAGVKPALVHYYFRTMDDLFLAVYRRRAEEGLERYARIPSSKHSLRTLWDISIEAAGTPFIMEFAALANHRKVIRGEIAHYSERFRRMQLEMMDDALSASGISADAYPPVALVLAMTGLSLALMLERSLGIDTGHAEAFAFVERQLSEVARGALRRKRA